MSFAGSEQPQLAAAEAVGVGENFPAVGAPSFEQPLQQSDNPANFGAILADNPRTCWIDKYPVDCTYYYTDPDLPRVIADARGEIVMAHTS